MLDKDKAYALLSLQDKATPGPWVKSAGFDRIVIISQDALNQCNYDIDVRLKGVCQLMNNALRGDNDGLFIASIHDISNTLRAALKELDSQQAHIDELMLEYCPDDMTEEQKSTWADSQVQVTDE